MCCGSRELLRGIEREENANKNDMTKCYKLGGQRARGEGHKGGRES